MQRTPIVTAAKKKRVLPYEMLLFSFLMFLAIIYTNAIKKPLNRETTLPKKKFELL